MARQEFRESVVGSHDLFVEVGGLRIFKRKISADHGVEYHTTAPNVCFKPMISLTSNHLWGGIARGSTCCLEGCSLLIHVTEAEVDNFEGKIIVKEEVLRLEISVADSTLMNVLDTRDELQVELAGLLFREPGVSHDVVEELTAVAVLHDHVQLFFGLNDFVELNDVGVSHLLQDLDLTSDSLHVFLVMDLVFLEDFNRNLNHYINI